MRSKRQEPGDDNRKKKNGKKKTGLEEKSNRIKLRLLQSM